MMILLLLLGVSPLSSSSSAAASTAASVLAGAVQFTIHGLNSFKYTIIQRYLQNLSVSLFPLFSRIGQPNSFIAYARRSSSCEATRKFTICPIASRIICSSRCTVLQHAHLSPCICSLPQYCIFPSCRGAQQSLNASFRKVHVHMSSFYAKSGVFLAVSCSAHA
jgi:hypothetical protein